MHGSGRDAASRHRFGLTQLKHALKLAITLEMLPNNHVA
jgi:hypothetical protein